MPSSNVCWGIDIGAGAIKAIRLERDGESARVADFVVVPHKRVLSTPDIVEADAIRVALGSFLGEYRDQLRGTTVVCSLPGHASFARFAKLPPVEAKGVENLVKFEAVQQIPFPIEEVEWDYQVFASDDTPEVEVGIFAVTRDRVNEKLSLWGEGGLHPDEITLGPVAAYNAIAYDLEFTENSPGTVIVDIGTVATDLIIAERGRVWIRTFPIGGHHFTETLAETFKLPYSKAEKLKKEAETSKYKRHIFQALKPILTDLVQDVQRSISYYTETHPNANLERVIGLGSTFKLLGLRKLMSQQLGIDVYRLEGFKRTTVEGSAAVEFDAVSINMATAYGLALQGLGLTPIRANLVPVSVTRDSMWQSKTPYFVAAAVIGLIGGASTFVQPLLNNSHTGNFNDPFVTGVINDFSRLNTSWSEIKDQYPLEFLPSNADALFVADAKTMHVQLLNDATALLAQATGDSDDRLYRLFSFRPDYLPPGTPLSGMASASGPGGSASTGRGGAAPGGRNPFGGGRDDGRPSPSGTDDTGGGADAVNDDSVAGPLGGFRITLELDSTTGDLPTFNDEVLEWLRDEENMYGNRYKIVGVPTVESVAPVTITPATRGDNVLPAGGGAGASPDPGRGSMGTRPPAGGAIPGSRNPGGIIPGSRNPGGTIPGVRDPGGRNSPITGRPGGTGSTGGSGGDTSLDGLAPIAQSPNPFEGAQELYRYTLTYFVQRLDKAFAAEAEPVTNNDDNNDF